MNEHSATAPASYDAPATIHNSPPDILTPELRAQVAEERLTYLLEVFRATQSRLRSLAEKTAQAANTSPRENRRALAQSAQQLKTLTEELTEAREAIAEHTAPLIQPRQEDPRTATLRHIDRQTRRAAHNTDRRKEDLATAYARTDEAGRAQ
jgi:uncharacterized coiled-coil protein SlyX